MIIKFIEVKGQHFKASKGDNSKIGKQNRAKYKNVFLSKNLNFYLGDLTPGMKRHIYKMYQIILIV